VNRPLDVIIFGSGAIGGRIAAFALQEGQRVALCSRNPGFKCMSSDDNLQLIPCDITIASDVNAVPKANIIVIAVAPEHRDRTSYEHLYIQGMNHIADYLKQSVPTRCVLVSSTGVWGSCNGEWVTEDSKSCPEKGNWRQKILLEAENIIAGAANTIVLRSGGIYGQGRHPLKRIKEGTVSWNDVNQYINLIHESDLVQCIAYAMLGKLSMGVFIAVDDEPVLRRDYLTFLRERVNPNLKIPSTRQISASGKRCSNQKLKDSGFCFQYPNFRVGYAQILKAEGL